MMVVVTVLLTPLAIWLVWRLGVKGDYRDQMAALRAAGVPLTTEEREKWLEQWPLLPVCPEFGKSHEAYVPPPMEVLEALPRFNSRPRGDDGESSLSQVPYDPADLEAMGGLVGQNGEALRILREARLGTELPCSTMKDRSDLIMELLCSAICVRAAEGNGAEAAELMLDGFAYARATGGLRKDPTGNWLTGYDGRLIASLSSASLRTTISEATLRAMQEHLEMADWVEGRKFQLVSELSGQVCGMADILRDNSEARFFNVLTGWSESQTAEIGREQLTRLALVEAPPDAQRKALDDFQYGYYVVSGPMVQYSLAWLGLEILCYHGTTGSLPESLAVLGLPASRTVDFYGEGDFKYVVEGNRFTVYSFGYDLKDDGGDAREDVVVMLGVGGS